LNRYDHDLVALESDWDQSWLKIPEKQDVLDIRTWRTKNRTQPFPKDITNAIDTLLDKVELRRSAAAGKGGTARAR
jgi:hypothetical protein